MLNGWCNARFQIVLCLEDKVLVILLLIILCHFAKFSVLFFSLGKGSALYFKNKVVVVLLILSQECLWDLDVNLITSIVDCNHFIRLIAVLIDLILLSWRGFNYL